MGHLLASADIRIAGVPSNAVMDGLVEGLTPREELSCRYTEFRDNHFFPETLRDGQPYQPNCTDESYAHRPECNPGLRYVCFARDTHTTVRIQVREVDGTSESVVTQMAFQYDRHPHVIAARVPVLRDIPGIDRLPALLLRGFFATDPPGVPSHCRSTLDETVCEGQVGPTPLGGTVPPPSRPYFLLQYAFEDPVPPPTPVAIDRVRESTDLLHPTEALAPTLPILEGNFERGVERTPIQQLVTAASRAFNQDMLEGWLQDFGLNGIEEARYRELGIPIGGIPRSVMNFLRLVRPLFSSDTRQRLNQQASTWNPNMIFDHSPLFLWSETQEVEINGLLRGGNLRLPMGVELGLSDRHGLRDQLWAEQAALGGRVTTSEDEEDRLTRRDVEFESAWFRRHSFLSAFNRVEIRANESVLRAAIVGASLSEVTIPLSLTPNGEAASLSLQRVFADRVVVELPPFNDLFNDTPIDPRPLRSIALENPYLRSLTLHYGTIALTLRNVRAERIEYQLPSPREIRERNLSPEQIWTQGHWILRGLQADSLRMDNPLYQLSIEMRNLQAEAERSVEHESSDPQVISIPITRLFAESIRTSMGGLGEISAENTELNQLNFELGPQRLSAQAERIFSQASIEYRGGDAPGDTRIRLGTQTTLTNLRLQMDYPPQGPLSGQVDFGISTDLGAGTLDLGRSGSVHLTRGSLSHGSFHSDFRIPSDPHATREYLNRLEGDLNVEVERVDHFQSDFNIPGFFLDGSLESLRLQGPARFIYGHDRLVIERPSSTSTPLSLEALIRETQIQHDPRVSDSALRRIPASDVVQSDATIHRARVRIDDFVRWASLPEAAPATPSEAPHRHLEVDFRGLQVTEIQAGGELWAALPPWRYLRGILSLGGSFIPLQRGRPRRPLPTGGDCSLLPGGIPAGISASDPFIYLGEWSSTPDGPGRTESRLQDFRACLRSEPVDTSGSRPYVVVGIPELQIHRGRRPAVTSGDAPIHFDACLLDLRRGGWICMTPAPRR
jgi:hypothetical protein